MWNITIEREGVEIDLQIEYHLEEADDGEWWVIDSCESEGKEFELTEVEESFLLLKIDNREDDD